MLFVTSEHWDLFNDTDKVILGYEVKSKSGGVLRGGVLTEGLVCTVNGFSACLEHGLLADWMRLGVLVGKTDTDCDLHGIGKFDLSNHTAVRTDTELVSDCLSGTIDLNKFESVRPVTNLVLLLVDDHGEGVNIDSATSSNWDVVSEGEVVVEEVLGGRKTTVDSVNLGVGEGEAESPALLRVHSTKVSLAVERVLVSTVRASNAPAKECGGERDTSHSLPFSVKWQSVVGV